MQNADREKGVLNRRELLIGSVSLFASAAALLFEAQEALASNSRKDIERLVSSGKYEEAIAKSKKEIQDMYGIYVDFPEKNIELREVNDEASYFAKLTEKTTQIGSLLDLRRYLLKFPPKSVPGLAKLSPTYLQQIVIASKVEGRTRRDGRYEVGGFAFSQRTRIALPVVQIDGPNGKMRFSIDKESLTHEISHLLLRDVTELEWAARINRKIRESFKDSFPENYEYTPIYAHRRKSEYDIKRPRPPGFGRFYGTDNFGDDLATIAEVIYHGTVSQREIDSERPPLLKVKIEILKEKIAEKLGYVGKHAISGQFYWSLVNTSSFVDKMFENVHDEKKIEKNIQEEFERWEGWWELFKK